MYNDQDLYRIALQQQSERLDEARREHEWRRVRAIGPSLAVRLSHLYSALLSILA